MDRVLNLQMSLFGSFINVRLETEIVIKLLTVLKDDGFIPGSADIASVDLKTGKMIVDSRMQILSPDKTWTIVFLPDRIDFNYNYQEGTTIYKNITNLQTYANELVKKVFSVFGSTMGNRLALNCKLMFEGMTTGDLKQFCARFTKPLSAYGDDPYVEWGVRFNARGNFKVTDSEKEECNRITEMAQIENLGNLEDKQIDSHSIILSIDVNTLPLNLTQRFKYENLIYFANDVTEFVTNVTKEIESDC